MLLRDGEDLSLCQLGVVGFGVSSHQASSSHLHDHLCPHLGPPPFKFLILFFLFYKE